MKKLLLVLLMFIVTGCEYENISVEPIGNPEYSQKNYSVPGILNLYLQGAPWKDEQDTNIALEFSAYGGSGCDIVSPLDYSQKLVDKNTIIDINGFSVQRYLGTDACIAVVQDSKGNIELTDLVLDEERLITFRVGGQESTYVVSKNQYGVFLTPELVTNVVSTRRGYNTPDSPKSLGYLNPNKTLGKLSLNGTYSHGVDYRESLKEVALQNNLIPLVDVLDGFEQSDEAGENHILYVFLEDNNFQDLQVLGSVLDNPNLQGSKKVDVILGLSESDKITMYSY